MSRADVVTCMDCRYWDPLGKRTLGADAAEYGFCRIRAPMAMVQIPEDPEGYTQHAVWPRTFYDDGCGEGEVLTARKHPNTGTDSERGDLADDAIW